MHSRSVLVFLFLTLFGLLSVMVSAAPAAPAAPPPPEATDVMDVISPSAGDYSVGQTLTAQIKIKQATFRAANPEVRLYIQKKIRYPALNVQLGTISASDLETGGFKFTLKKEWLIEDQKNIPFRIRVSWSEPKTGYRDSEGFTFH